VQTLAHLLKPKGKGFALNDDRFKSGSFSRNAKPYENKNHPLMQIAGTLLLVFL
jgi:hypothetical protein